MTHRPSWESLANAHGTRGDFYRARLCWARHVRNITKHLPAGFGVAGMKELRPLSDFKRSR